MSKKHVTFGGMGQHEFYMPTTGKGYKNRRDRKMCEFYFSGKGYCSKIRNQCVGPTICMKYREKVLVDVVKKKNIDVGAVVYHKVQGKGEIVTISCDICTVQFITGKKITFRYPDAFDGGLLTTL